MNWDQVLTIVASNIVLILASLGTTITLFLWARGEASTDRREWHEEASADRRDILTLMRGIQEEMKDFHSRLCIIEERRKEEKQ